MLKNGIPSLGDVYGEMLGSITPVNESTIKKGGNDFGTTVPLIKGGPQTKGGFHKSLHDEILSMYDNPAQDLDEDEETGEDTETEEEDGDETFEEEDEEVVQESQKTQKPKLNTSMSKRTLSFDSLFNKLVKENFDPSWGAEDAEDDIDALGLGDASTDSDLGDDFGGEDEGEQVTVTLDRATAQTLIDLLQGALGGAEEALDDGAGEIEDDGLDEGGDEGLNFDEDEETIGAKDGKGGGEKHKLQTKSNKVSGKPQPSGSGGASNFQPTDKVGNDGDHGHALHGAKQPNTGKNNKVSNLKQGADFFK